MIDIENAVFDRVSEKVRSQYPDIFMSGEYVKSPSSFPCASIIEMDNSAYEYSQTSSEMENHASVMYEVNVYSNRKKYKKAECKAIMALIDKEMQSMGFSRIMMNPIPNMDDATIYRMVARYRAIVSKDNVIYRR